MRRVFKVEGQYLTPPIKAMFKLRMLKKLKDKYNTSEFENKRICGYYFPDDNKEYTYVNILIMEKDYDRYDDEEGYEDETVFYVSNGLMAKDSYNDMNMFRVPLKYIKNLRIVQKFPRESVEEYRDTLPDDIYGWDGSVYEEYEAAEVCQIYYY